MRIIAVLLASMLLLVAMVGGAAGVDGADPGEAPPVEADLAVAADVALAAGGGGTTHFEDVPAGFTHAAAIDWMVSAGISSGCAPGRFCPGEPVTRAQLASLLSKALDLPAAADAGFADVPAGSTHAAGINAVVAAGISQGCGDGRFCPGQAVTRAQLATLFTGAFELPAAPSAGFRDVPADSTHAAGINALAASGITQGCSHDRFCPGQAVTRAQLASLLKAGLHDTAPTMVDDLCDLEGLVAHRVGPVVAEPVPGVVDACRFVGETSVLLVRNLDVSGDPFAVSEDEQHSGLGWAPVGGVGDDAGWRLATDEPFAVGEPMLLVQVGTSTLAVQLTCDDGAEMGLHDHVQVAKKVLVPALGHGSTLPPPGDSPAPEPDKPDEDCDADAGGSPGTVSPDDDCDDDGPDPTPHDPGHDPGHDPDKPDPTRPCLPSDGSLVTYVKETGREVQFCATDLMHLDLACRPAPPGDLLPNGTYTTEPCLYIEEVIDGVEVCETIVYTLAAWERIIQGPGWILAD